MTIAQPLLEWYHQVKRDLPWRGIHDPYHIWLSQIMLQQTRVQTVKGYYRRFLMLFPTIADLAAAPEEQVLKAWEGLGYYSRARNLQKAAKQIVNEHNGVFPQSYQQVLALPGIGEYTAGAVCSFAFGQAVPAIDGNVYRVASRVFGVREDVASPAVQKQIRQLVTDCIPVENPGDFNQAMMELGATLCKPGTPQCECCPLCDQCDAYREGDADLLPVHMKKKPPKTIPMTVVLLQYDNRVLVVRRSEKMLKGLYVFLLLQEATDQAEAQAVLEQMGLQAEYVESRGQARHVFTHRVWQMEHDHFRVKQAPDEHWLIQHDAMWVDAEQLDVLPLPTAMKYAKAQAMAVLGRKHL